MALRLGELVVAGELINLKNYSTHGWLELAGQDRPLTFELTGNCGSNLRGRHIRFELSDPGQAEARLEELRREIAAGRHGDTLSGLAWQQIGPVGTMVIDRVRVFDCPVEEFLTRSKLGEPPPTRWAPRLYLEWYSQNARVVLEITGFQIEQVEINPELAGQTPPEPASDGPGIVEVRLDDQGQADVRELSAPGPDEEEEAAGPADPYGLFPDDLQAHLDRETAWQGDAEHVELDRAMYETELMDDLIENDPGQPVGSLLDGLKDPTPADMLDDHQCEVALMSILMQLAMFGVAFDVCEHLSPREAYRVLIEQVLPDASVYPQLRGTQWVQHYGTSDYCPKCIAELDAPPAGPADPADAP